MYKNMYNSEIYASTFFEMDVAVNECFCTFKIHVDVTQTRFFMTKQDLILVHFEFFFIYTKINKPIQSSARN